MTARDFQPILDQLADLSLEQVEALATGLRTEMQKIDAQLSDPNREDGRDHWEYERWRRSAAYAKTRIAADYTRVKQRRSELRQQRTLGIAGVETAVPHCHLCGDRTALQALIDLVLKMKEETGYWLSPREQDIVSAARLTIDAPPVSQETQE